MRVGKTKLQKKESEEGENAENFCVQNLEITLYKMHSHCFCIIGGYGILHLIW
jgi:hypothetical protein